ncbi:hypothetical protein [Candidatus Sororendozoicomonas aggregata]|uniref:hypothetical protein n=1 Tax=Candidatus Sororendozoicomonas aggregata TaxID=3073239 RepID=UPI002ED33931
MAQTIKKINKDKLLKSSGYVQRAAKSVLEQAYEALEQQEAFFNQAGVTGEQVKVFLSQQRLPDKEKEALDLWKAAFTNSQHQLAERVKKDMREARKLLKNRPRSRQSSGLRRCTKIF